MRSTWDREGVQFLSHCEERPLLEEFQVQLQLGVLVEKLRSASK